MSRYLPPVNGCGFLMVSWTWKMNERKFWKICVGVKSRTHAHAKQTFTLVIHCRQIFALSDSAVVSTFGKLHYSYHTRKGKEHIFVFEEKFRQWNQWPTFSKSSVFKTFSVYTKTKSQRFPVFVKDRPNRRNKAVFSNFSGFLGPAVLRNDSRVRNFVIVIRSLTLL